MKKATLLVILLLPLTTVLSAPGFSDRTGSDEAASIAETIFRHQIRHCYRYRSPKVYFLLLDGKDPSDDFMEQFKESVPPVKKASQMDNWARDKETGEQGIALAVEKIKQIDESKAEAEGGCVAGGLDGYGYRYSLVKENGRWVIKDAQGTWVS
jgi:hypothetical protein